MADKEYVLICDTREQKGWAFRKAKGISAVVERALPTGDYSFEGFENKFVVERKGSPGELITNLFSDDKERFIRELERLKEFDYAWIICEFEIGDISDHLNMLARSRWKKGRKSFFITMDKVLGYIASLTVKYGANFIFCNKKFAKDLGKKLLLKAAKSYDV